MSLMESIWRTVGVLFIFLMQSASATDCSCDLTNTEKPFPKDKLLHIETSAGECYRQIQSAKMSDEAALRLGVQQRLLQLQNGISALEREDDGGLYGAVSLRILELELAEILQLINKLNGTHNMHQSLSTNVKATMQQVKADLKELEKLDQMQIVQKLETNKQLQRSLAQCQENLEATAPPPTPIPTNCSHGRLVNVEGPRTYTGTQYGTSYHYGAWGRDPQPAAGKENWYWLVALTSSNVFANYVRQYSSLSALIAGVSPRDVSIASGNPTTNTIQGPNVVMYGDALYYGCYNSPHVCRFNMTTRAITTVAFPHNTGINNKFPFCHLDACYSYTDLDFMTDESGVWVAYSSVQNYGNLIISEVEPSNVPKLGRTMKTSLHKRTATNTFMVCGVLYATRYVDKETEEIFYSFDTRSGTESFSLSIQLKKMSTNIYSLNYNPSDQKLYVYSDSYVISYDAIFE